MGIVSAMMQVGAAIKHAVAALFRVTHSLRFENPDADFLTQSNQATATDSDKWTLSVWIKVASNGVTNNNSTIRPIISGGENNCPLFLDADDRLAFYEYNGSSVLFEVYTTETIKVADGWTHVVMSVDYAANVTLTDKVKIWIDGTLASLTTKSNTLGSGAWNVHNNYASAMNGTTHTQAGSNPSRYIGKKTTALGRYFSGQMSEFHFIDGQALDASYFGETRSGQWVPKEVTGVTYGNNGFYLPFSTPSSTTNAFNAVTYTGDGASSRNITGVGMQADMIWIKNRDYAASNTNYNHILMDSVRGKSGNEYLHVNPNETWAEATFTGYGLTAIGTDGFTVTGNGGLSNATGDDYIAWAWKAGGAPTSSTSTTTGSAMVDGEATTTSSIATAASASITPTKMSVNTEAGFSIVQYDGTGASGATVPHGLSQTPECIIVKNTDATNNWLVYHADMDANPEQKRIFLNLSDAKTDSTTPWNDTAPTSSLITLGQSGYTNGNTDKMIMYCWHSVEGYSKFGSYSGNFTSDNYVELGFKPAFVMVKATNNARSWAIFDNARDPNNQTTQALRADMTNGDLTGSVLHVDFEATGFRLKGTDSLINNTYDYIYMAFADTSPNLGLDATTNTNNFAVNGNITPDDQLIDSPNLRFATLDPATASASASVLSNANLTQNIGTTVGATLSDASFSAGKYYAEVRIDSMGNPANAWVGVSGNSNTAWDGGYYWGASAGVGTGRQYSASSNDTFGSNPAVGNIIQIAVDRDNGKIWWGLNGTWQQNGGTSPDPATGTDAAYTDASGPLGTQALRFGGQDGSGSDVNTELTWNFGQDHTFAGSKSPLSSPFTDDDGNGEFYYQPPAGFKALATSY